MSTWDKRNKAMMMIDGKKEDGTPRTCLVCGKAPDAIWAGTGIITVCRGCAVDVLPRLIADALFRARWEPGSGLTITKAFKEYWTRAGASFWQGVAHNLSFLGRKPQWNSLDDEEPGPTSLFGDEKRAS